ncbi:hypothetical protein JTE90_011037 [Oedothorax gibbosus]|uniref:Uncharacterized protein n=1 Tax=Oedothorax gibbosus TaxID=931172 RepID=A0AAV6VCP3_9ARAC|nr:hypothetical protein JTE90_011037 [Oedothorax gibbosus]
MQEFSQYRSLWQTKNKKVIVVKDAGRRMFRDGDQKGCDVIVGKACFCSSASFGGEGMLGIVPHHPKALCLTEL